MIGEAGLFHGMPGFVLAVFFSDVDVGAGGIPVLPSKQKYIKKGYYGKTFG